MNEIRFKQLITNLFYSIFLKFKQALRDLEIIKSLHFDISNIQDKGDYYLVENDIMLFKTNLKEYLNSGSEGSIELRQAHGGKLISSNYQHVINVRSSGLPIEWKIALDEAILEWNQTGSNICMRSNIMGFPDILVTVDNNIDAIAVASYPSGGKSGNSIKVNTGYNYYTPSQKKYVMTHELGHSLGLRHTNEGGGTHITGTLRFDANSIMNGATGGANWKGFSNDDILAINTLYPLKKIVLVPSRDTYKLSWRDSFGIDAANLRQGSPVTWTVSNDKVLSIGYSSGRPYPIFTSIACGECKIRAKSIFGTAELSTWIGEPGKDIGTIKKGDVFKFVIPLNERLRSYALSNYDLVQSTNEYALFKISTYGTADRTLGTIMTYHLSNPSVSKIYTIYGTVVE